MKFFFHKCISFNQTKNKRKQQREHTARIYTGMYDDNKQTSNDAKIKARLTEIRAKTKRSEKGDKEKNTFFEI